MLFSKITFTMRRVFYYVNLGLFDRLPSEFSLAKLYTHLVGYCTVLVTRVLQINLFSKSIQSACRRRGGG